MRERVAEIALLMLLFAVGLQRGVPLRDYRCRWRVPGQRLRRHASRRTSGSARGSGNTLPQDFHQVSVDMRDPVRGFNEQLKKPVELPFVLVVGALLASTHVVPRVWWFVPIVLVVLRPVPAPASTAGEGLTTTQRRMIGWFGTRGIGPVFYLLFALRMAIEGSTADTLVSLTLWTAAAPIVAHGITAQPLMRHYILRWNSDGRG